MDLGLTSTKTLALRKRLAGEFKRDISAADVFNHPTVSQLAVFMEREELSSFPKSHRSKNQDDTPVAVIGMACRFPGAEGPDEFWGLLLEKRDMVREVPLHRWDLDEHYYVFSDSELEVRTDFALTVTFF